MASPSVGGVVEGGLTSANVNLAVVLPGGGSATDDYIVIIAKGSAACTINALANWTELLDENVAHGLAIIRYTGAGVPSNPTFVQSTSSRSVWCAYRIPGASKTIAPEVGTTATGTSNVPNPPSRAVTGGPKDILAIAMFTGAGELTDNDTLVTTFPTNYTDGQVEKTGGTAGTNLGGLLGAAARQITNVSSEDPGTFTQNASRAWRANTLVIHPAPAAYELDAQPASYVWTPVAATLEAALIQANLRQRKSAAVGPGSAVFDSAPVEGNLLVATAFARTGTSPTLTSSGWTNRIARDTELSNGDYRRSLYIWTKIAGASESATVTFGGTAALVEIQEFEHPAGASFDLLASASNDDGTVGDSQTLSTGLTAATVSEDSLAVGFRFTRLDNAGVPTNFGWDDVLLNDIEVDEGGFGRHMVASWGEDTTTGQKEFIHSWADFPTDAGSSTGLVVFSLAAPVEGAYELDAQPATYSFTGVAAGAQAGRVVNAQPASYALTGVASSPVAGRVVNAQPASYAVSAAAAGVLAARVLNAQPASYVLTGVDAALHASRVLSADPASYVLTATEAELLLTAGGVTHYELNAEPAAFLLTWANAGLLADRVLSADPADFVLTGFIASVLADRTLSADPASYDFTGADASLIVDRVMAALAASYVFTGRAAELTSSGEAPALENRIRTILMNRFGIY